VGPTAGGAGETDLFPSQALKARQETIAMPMTARTLNTSRSYLAGSIPVKHHLGG
jgi:hypothetical protein